MSDRAGVGLLDLAILEACRSVGATSDARHLKTARVLDRLLATEGVGPAVAYEPLCLMARPGVLHLPLIDFHGNAGSPDFGPASPKYTECRLTPLAEAVLRSERGDLGPLPVGLVNGDLYVGGAHPPFDADRIIAAISAASDGATDDEIVGAVGLPVFADPCTITVDWLLLAAAAPTELEMTAAWHLETTSVRSRLTDTQAEAIVVTGLPLGSAASELAGDLQTITARRSSGPDHPADLLRAALRDVNDASSGGTTRLEIVLRPGADAAPVIAVLEQLWSFRQHRTVRLRRPLADLVREFVEPRADLAERLAIVTDARR